MAGVREGWDVGEREDAGGSSEEVINPYYSMIHHFVYVPWTGLGLHDGYRGDAWLLRRIEIFKAYVLPSLLNQTSRAYTLWFSFRPEEESNPIVQEFVRSLASIAGLRLVVTYSGVCFWDDKYDRDTAYQRLLKALEGALPILAGTLPEEVDKVYMTINASDDMYLSHAFKEIQDYPFKVHRTVGYRFGYIMDYGTKGVAEYNPATVPPFFTIMFPKANFLDPYRHLEYTGPYESHEFIKDTTEYVALPGRGFVVGTHSSNISTTFEHPYQGALLGKEDAESVLLRTGTLYAEPVRHAKAPGLVLRSFINRLPFQGALRAIYYKSPWRI